MSKSPKAYRGLFNQGATCYLNSFIQSLYFTPELREAVYKFRYDAAKDGSRSACISLQLQYLFARMYLYRSRAVDTESLTNSFGWGAEASFEQQDVQEFIQLLFQCIEKANPEATVAKFITEQMHGTECTFVNCTACGSMRQTDTPFLNLSLSIKGLKSMEESVSVYITPETLSGENAVRCSSEKCQDSKQTVIKGSFFKKFPAILCVQLKRFAMNYMTMSRVKLFSSLTFPEQIDMTTFLGIRDPTLAASWTPEQSEAGEEYELYSILIHQGSSQGGHYYAYIKDAFNNNAWIKVNDASVSYLSEEEVKEMFDYEYLVSKKKAEIEAKKAEVEVMKKAKEDALKRLADSGASISTSGVPIHSVTISPEDQDTLDDAERAKGAAAAATLVASVFSATASVPADVPDAPLELDLDLDLDLGDFGLPGQKAKTTTGSGIPVGGAGAGMEGNMFEALEKRRLAEEDEDARERKEEEKRRRKMAGLSTDSSEYASSSTAAVSPSGSHSKGGSDALTRLVEEQKKEAKEEQGYGVTAMAYMLMYRRVPKYAQKDKKDNQAGACDGKVEKYDELALLDALPADVRKEVEGEIETAITRQQEREADKLKRKVFVYHSDPALELRMQISCMVTDTVQSVFAHAFTESGFGSGDPAVTLSRVRLRQFDQMKKRALEPLSEAEYAWTVGDLAQGYLETTASLSSSASASKNEDSSSSGSSTSGGAPHGSDANVYLFLEQSNSSGEFEDWQPVMVTLRVVELDTATMELKPAQTLSLGDHVKGSVLRKKLADMLGTTVDHLQMVVKNYAFQIDKNVAYDAHEDVEDDHAMFSDANTIAEMGGEIDAQRVSALGLRRNERIFVEKLDAPVTPNSNAPVNIYAGGGGGMASAAEGASKLLKLLNFEASLLRIDVEFESKTVQVSLNEQMTLTDLRAMIGRAIGVQDNNSFVIRYQRSGAELRDPTKKLMLLHIRSNHRAASAADAATNAASAHAGSSRSYLFVERGTPMGPGDFIFTIQGEKAFSAHVDKSELALDDKFRFLGDLVMNEQFDFDQVRKAIVGKFGRARMGQTSPIPDDYRLIRIRLAGSGDLDRHFIASKNLRQNLLGNMQDLTFLYVQALAQPEMLTSNTKFIQIREWIPSKRAPCSSLIAAGPGATGDEGAASTTVSSSLSVSSFAAKPKLVLKAWNCEVCTYTNSGIRRSCEMCESPKPLEVVCTAEKEAETEKERDGAAAAPADTPAPVFPVAPAAAPDAMSSSTSSVSSVDQGGGRSGGAARRTFRTYEVTVEAGMTVLDLKEMIARDIILKEVQRQEEERASTESSTGPASPSASDSAALAIDAAACPLCGDKNACAVAQGKAVEECWCQQEAETASFPKKEQLDRVLATALGEAYTQAGSEQVRRCICKQCLTRIGKGEPIAASPRTAVSSSLYPFSSLSSFASASSLSERESVDAIVTHLRVALPPPSDLHKPDALLDLDWAEERLKLSDKIGQKPWRIRSGDTVLFLDLHGADKGVSGSNGSEGASTVAQLVTGFGGVSSSSSGGGTFRRPRREGGMKILTPAEQQAREDAAAKERADREFALALMAQERAAARAGEAGAGAADTPPK